MKKQIEIELLNIYLNAFGEGYGVDIIRINWDTLETSSFFKFCVLNAGNHRMVSVDFFFLKNTLKKYLDDLNEKTIYNEKSVKWWERLIISGLLKKLL